MPRTMLARLLVVAGTMAIGLAVPGVAQSPPDVRFPIILTDAAKLLDAGFALRETFVMRGEFEGDPPASAPHRCNDLWFSVSDAVLARHRQRGFTLETLCLGLWSKDLKFDPETGKRIATFIWISPDDRTDLLGRLKGRDPKAMTAPQVKAIDEDDLILFEQPFRIPDCFRNATPLLDCQWRYDHQSGRPLAAETTKRYRAVGQAIDAGLTRALRGDVLNCKAGDEWPCKPLPPASGRPGTYHVIGAPSFAVQLARSRTERNAPACSMERKSERTSGSDLK